MIHRVYVFWCLDMTSQTHNKILLVVSTKLASQTDQPGHPLPLPAQGYPRGAWCVGGKPSKPTAAKPQPS